MGKNSVPGTRTIWFIFTNFAPDPVYFPHCKFLFVKRRPLKLITNKYVITAIIFLLLMLFFDQNDWFTQREREKELNELQSKIDHMNQESDRMDKELNQLNNSPGKLEQYAREKYHEKKDGEDVYLIITDSVKTGKTK
jgi:cell division protein DivIC